MKRLREVAAYEFDLTALKADPGGYASKLSARLLRQLYRRAKNTYYKGSPFLSDAEFDAIEDTFRQRFPDSPLLQKVGAPVDQGKKQKLPYWMGSLDKIKPNTPDLDRWFDANPGPYVVSDKMDGISMLIICTKGRYHLFTRGNGKVGQDVTSMVPILGLPKTQDTFAVRAEIIMSETAFKKYAKDFANPRNFMGGLVNRPDVSPALKDATLVCYELIVPRKKPSEQLNYLKHQLGFTVAPAKAYKVLDAQTLSDRLIARRKSSKFAIDGLVVTQDSIYKRATSGNPRYSVAFKMLMEDQIVKCRVVSVEWNVSKHGILKPTVIVEPM